MNVELALSERYYFEILVRGVLVIQLSFDFRFQRKLIYQTLSWK